MPRRQSPRLIEDARGVGLAARADAVDGLVVERHDGRGETGDHQILVVARIHDDRAPGSGARQILERSAALEA
jgi:hypothetical protein